MSATVAAARGAKRPHGNARVLLRHRSDHGRPPSHCGDGSRDVNARRTATTGSAADFLPKDRTLPALRKAAKGCRGCHLWQRATQTVFGAGPSSSRVMLVGEQPGHEEDLAGAPFVGPAGRILDRALEDVGIDRRQVYVTNVVKHFKWEAKGKRRIHAKPSQLEVSACRPWLEAELEVVKPAALVCLGATAAQALLGPKFRVTRQRGEWISVRWASHVMATVHPSAILRAPDEEARHAEMERFVADLALLREVLPGR
jgi:uracil-DNA glycosylase family protein